MKTIFLLTVIALSSSCFARDYLKCTDSKGRQAVDFDITDTFGDINKIYGQEIQLLPSVTLESGTWFAGQLANGRYAELTTPKNDGNFQTDLSFTDGNRRLFSKNKVNCQYQYNRK